MARLMTLRAHVYNCVPVASLNAAVACRGSVLGGAIFAAAAAERFETFDELVAGAPDLLDVIVNAGGLLAASGEPRLQVFIAGWAESGPESYVVNSHEGIQPGMVPGILYPLDPFSASPLPSAADLDRVGWSSTVADITKFDAERHGAVLVEAQRHMRFVPPNGGPPCHQVGVHVALTEITREGITQRIVHRWPDDRIGELIVPSVPSLAPSALSRQQRRALARKGA
jgi:hypothetical protein